MAKKEPDITLVLDFGGSMTKGVYLDKVGEVRSLCMEPEAISLTKEAIENYEATKLGSPDPVDAAWVGIDGGYYAVGYLAKQFYGNPGLNSFKYERAFVKALAAVWAVTQKLGLTKKKLMAALAILLPAGEYEHATRLKELIVDGLANFQTPTGKMNVSVSHWECKPEGGGIFLVYAKNQGAAALSGKTVAVLMLGHRNASALICSRGQVSKRVTSNLGFIRLVELVEKRIATIDSTAQLSSAIALAGQQVDTKYLAPLARSSTRDYQLDEIHQFADAIKAARPQYLMLLTSWMKEVLPRELDEVILCGGTAEYLKTDLEKYFMEKCLKSTKIVWNGGVELPSDLLAGLGTRFSDAYGLHQYFLSQIGRTLVGVANDCN